MTVWRVKLGSILKVSYQRKKEARMDYFPLAVSRILMSLMSVIKRKYTKV